MKIQKTVEVTDQEAWEAIFGCDPDNGRTPWILRVEYLDGAAWDKPGRAMITMWDGLHEDGDDFTQSHIFNVSTMQEAYQKALDLDLVHCGGHFVAADFSDPDECTADMLLQLFMYGEIVYG